MRLKFDIIMKMSPPLDFLQIWIQNRPIVSNPLCLKKKKLRWSMFKKTQRSLDLMARIQNWGRQTYDQSKFFW